MHGQPQQRHVARYASNKTPTVLISRSCFRLSLFVPYALVKTFVHLLCTAVHGHTTLTRASGTIQGVRSPHSCLQPAAALPVLYRNSPCALPAASLPKTALATVPWIAAAASLSSLLPDTTTYGASQHPWPRCLGGVLACSKLTAGNHHTIQLSHDNATHCCTQSRKGVLTGTAPPSLQQQTNLCAVP